MMQKRPSKPQRFAAVENDAIDKLPSLLAVGLLTRLIRAKDGEDVTVESLCGDYAEGETSLSKAMRALVSEAFVVKFKVQRATSEPVLDEAGEQVLDEAGKPVIKRGGSWYTTFSVDSHRFTAEDVAEMADAILAGGNVKAIRIEPENLDPRKIGPASAASPSGARPTPRNPGVGPTRGNAVSRPAPAFPGVGQAGVGRPTPLRPGVGQAGALYKEETVFKDSLSLSVTGAPSVTGAGGPERETASPTKNEGDAAAASGSAEVSQEEQQAAARRKAATDFMRNLPGRLGPQTVRSLAPLAMTAMADGWTLSELRRFLISRCDTTKIRCPEVIYRRDLRDLPEPQLRRAQDPCPQHPSREADDCLPCRATPLDDDHDRGRFSDEDRTSAKVKERAAAIRQRLRGAGQNGLPNPAQPPQQRRNPAPEQDADHVAATEGNLNLTLARLEEMATQASSPA
ncbi:hypothetical protein ACWGII_38035 [Streptomyces sp. NPDC054855]